MVGRYTARAAPRKMKTKGHGRSALRTLQNFTQRAFGCCESFKPHRRVTHVVNLRLPDQLASARAPPEGRCPQPRPHALMVLTMHRAEHGAEHSIHVMYQRTGIELSCPPRPAATERRQEHIIIFTDRDADREGGGCKFPKKFQGVYSRTDTQPRSEDAQNKTSSASSAPHFLDRFTMHTMALLSLLVSPTLAFMAGATPRSVQTSRATPLVSTPQMVLPGECLHWCHSTTPHSLRHGLKNVNMLRAHRTLFDMVSRM